MKDALAISCENNDLSRGVALPGPFPVELVAEAMDVPRSRLMESLGDTYAMRPRQYRKDQD